MRAELTLTSTELLLLLLMTGKNIYTFPSISTPQFLYLQTQTYFLSIICSMVLGSYAQFMWEAEEDEEEEEMGDKVGVSPAMVAAF